MQNIEVRFTATTDFAKTRTDLAALTAQVDALNASLQKGALGTTGHTPVALDAGRWKQAAAAVEVASSTYRDAASSSGLFTTQQIRAVSETERFTKALQQQKLSMGDMIRNRGIMKGVYDDQLKMQRMTAQYWGTDSQGRGITDITMPKNVPTELDKWRRQMGMFGNMAASAGTQIVNLGKNIQWSGRQLTVGFTYPMALFGAAAGVMAYKVDNAFANINKVYDFSARAQQNEAQMAKEQGNLRVQSLEMATQAAKEYGVTVESTLKIEQELAATGLSGNKLMATTLQTQRISALGNIDPQQTEQMIVAMQTAFKKTIPDAKSLTNTLNFMNAASNATSLSLQDIAQAVPRAASGFAQLGGNAKQMTVLLVAMREAGVEAAQGANALKSASTRIINPPTKALAFYQQYKINLEQIARESGGNLFKYLELFGKEQEKVAGKSAKQTALLRAQGVATLFGTYQNNRMTAALVNLTEAYGGANNQTSKALALMKQTPQELAKTAAASQKAMMDNPAAKFRQEWALLQIQLQEMGQPFLAVANDILKFFTTVTRGFNNMSDWSKHLLLLGAGIAAIVGPVVMLTGLFLNMTGQFVKGVGSIAKIIGISRIYTKEQMAAELTTKAQNDQLVAMATNTETNIRLTDTYAREIAVLTEALQQSMTQIKLALSDGSAAMEGQISAVTDLTTAVVDGEATQQAAIEETIAAIEAKNAAEFNLAKASAKIGNFSPVIPQMIPAMNAPKVPSKMATDFRGASFMVADTEAQAAANAALAERIALSNKEVVIRADLINKANAEATIQQKTNKFFGTGAVMMGLMGASMATMMITSNKTANDIAKWAMVGAIALPAVKGLVAGMKLLNTETLMQSGLVTGITEKWAAMGAVNLAAGGGLRGAGAVVGSLGTGLAGMAMSVTGITLGITAAVAGLYMWNRHISEINRNQLNAQNSLTSMADDWGAAVGRVEKKYTGIKAIATEITSIGYNPNAFDKNFQYYTQKSQGRQAVSTFRGLSPSEQDTAGVNTYINLIQRWGLTAKQAKTNLTAMLVASGMEFYAASEKAQNWSNAVDGGGKSALNMGKSINAQIAFLKQSTSGIDDNTTKLSALNTAAKNFSENFGEAFKNSKTPEAARRMFDDLSGVVSDGWKKLYQSTMNTAMGRAFLQGKGISSAGQFQQFGLSQGYAPAQPTTGKGANPLAGIMNSIQYQRQYEHTIVRNIAEVMHLGDSVRTVAELNRAWAIQARKINYTTALKDVMMIADTLTSSTFANILKLDPKFASKDTTDQFKEMLSAISPEKLAGIQSSLAMIADAQGIKVGKTAWQTYNNILNDVKVSVDKVKNSVDGIPNQKNITLSIQAKQIPGIVQTAMSGVESDMAAGADAALSARQNAVTNALQARQSAASNALSSRQQSASNALQNRQQAAQTAMDNRFKARQDAINKSYQKRIDAVNKEIAAEQKADQIRQRLYEREKARIQQLADLQNNTIDFNMAVDEGRLQDAAKTANTAEAQSLQNEMDSELAAAQNRMQTRIDALNKKNDRLAKQRDNELNALQKLEDREKTHLQKIQQLRTQALQKQQAAETAALQKKQAAENAALQASQDAEKQNLDAKLALFQSYVAKNKNDLDRWMRTVGLTYDQFGKDITNKGESWANSFQVALQQHIREAGAKVASDNMWSKMGASMADQLLKGIGFASRSSFEHFVKTGTLPKNFGETHHGGGVVGQGSTGRAGKTGKVGNDERYVLAQDGEMIVNKNASTRYGPLLHAINKGTWDGIDRDAHGGFSFKTNAPTPKGSAFAPISGIVAAGVANLFEGGVATAMRQYIRQAANKMARGHIGTTGPATGFSGYVPGPGGRHRPVPTGIPISQGPHDIGVGGPGWSAIDLAAPVGTRAYAVENGVITSSSDIRGYEPRRMVYGQTGAGVQDGFRSYGRVMTLHTDGGADVLYAHLKSRGLGAGAHVKGGSVIGLTGNTGNVQSSSGNGAHLHFASDISPYAFLRKGGMLKWDNTMVMGHKGETMLSAPLTKKFQDNVASGGGSHYDITLDLRGAFIKEDVDIEKAVFAAIDKKEAGQGRSKVVRSKIG